jgi:hypothetical protein
LLPVIVAHWRWWPMWLVAAMLVVPVPVTLGYFGAAPGLQLTVGSTYGWALVICLLTLLAARDDSEVPARA